jgi:hypothetical protein
MRFSPVNVPKRPSAAVSAHRSAAQYGQNSPPLAHRINPGEDLGPLRPQVRGAV